MGVIIEFHLLYRKSCCISINQTEKQIPNEVLLLRGSRQISNITSEKVQSKDLVCNKILNIFCPYLCF